VEDAESAADLKFGQPGSYKLTMSAQRDELVCTRDLTFGNDGFISFARSSYGTLKRIFDEVHRRDETTLSLKQVATPGGTE
jgi:hypothetical protein